MSGLKPWAEPVWGSNQAKVFVTAWDQGVRVTLYVNEPKGGLDPDGIVPTVRSLLELLPQTCEATLC